MDGKNSWNVTKDSYNRRLLKFDSNFTCMGNKFYFPVHGRPSSLFYSMLLVRLRPYWSLLAHSSRTYPGFQVAWSNEEYYHSPLMVSAMNSGLRGPGPRGLAHWPRRVNVLCSWTRHYSHCTGRQASASHTLAYGWLPPPIHPHTHNPTPSHFVKFTWIHPSEQIRTGELLTCYVIYITLYIFYILWYPTDAAPQFL